ncbi:Uncharacterized protein HZ326_22759 [Fusarium oxysporum f. sp. albedinis]|nr:Uncharacterized protein HZ326_22759 [Fusarium oxysporum f. sp. albedinis]
MRKWKIEDQVGTVISDNISSNNSYLLNFYRDLNAEIGPAERKKGPVGKLQNVIKFIRSSPQRCELFKRISRENDEAQEYLLASETAELEVVMNSDTRWNSTYLMISRVLVKQGDIRAFLVHPEVEKWLPEANITQGWGSEGGNGRLWEVMTGMELLLEHLKDRKLFYHAVPDEAIGENTNSQVELARRRPDRNRQIPARFRDYEMDIHPRKSIQSSLPGRGSGQCEDGLGKLSGSSAVNDIGKDHRRYLRLSIITAWQKLNKYYTKLRELSLFAASIILNPLLGISYLEVN